MSDVIVYLLAIASIVSMAHLGLFVAGANAYDIRRLRQARLATKNQVKGGRAKGPLVSVVVPAHNEEQGIIRTLDSVRKSTYQRVEIIVVDDGSTDKTSQVVRNYMSRLRKGRRVTYLARASGRNRTLVRRSMHGELQHYPITLVRQKNGGKGSAVNNGIRNHAKGSLVMTLDADSMIHPNAIANAVAYFKDRRVVGVAANVRIMGSGWVGTLQRFEHLVGYRSKKFYTMTNSEFIVGGVASTYRKSVLKQVGYYDTDTQTEDIGLSMKIVAKLGNRHKRIVYASDVVAMTEGVQTYRALIRQRYRWKLGSLQNLYKYRDLMGKMSGGTHNYMLTLYRLPMALLGEVLLLFEPLMLTYLIYLSIERQNIGIFFGAYLTITLYTLWNIWPDEHMAIKQKLKMSFSAFGIYILFYAMTVVQLLAIYKCVKNFRKIVDLSGQANTWVSPARASTQQAVV